MPVIAAEAVKSEPTTLKKAFDPDYDTMAGLMNTDMTVDAVPPLKMVS
jgi:hypothetical protein